MRTIYKYDIMNADEGLIEGPITKLLYVAEQHGTICVWAEVDTDGPQRKFQIMPIGTGWDLTSKQGHGCILDTHTYIGTVILMNGNLVFHVYAAEVLPTSVKKPQPPKEKKEKKVAINDTKEASFSGTITMINPDILRQFIK